MKILVCGGRDYTDSAAVFRELDRLAADSPTPIVIIEGGQRTRDPKTGLLIGGADYWAYAWATTRRVKCRTVRADWKALGKAAGPIRNKRMLDEEKPDVVLTFPGGRGTANMVEIAEAAGVKVIRSG